MGKERILIVDDEKNIVSSLKNILTDEGYDVTCAEDGLDALEIIQSDPPDLVLLDIWIPGMDGIEVLRTIKTYNSAINVLIMSGHASIDTAVQATKLGASHFIEKPFSIDQVVQSIENVFQEKKNKIVRSELELSPKLELLLCFEMMMDVKKGIKNAARHGRPVLLLGEKGTGKELIAQAVHRQGKKSDRPFIKLNCAVRRMQDIQTQLFGETTPPPLGEKQPAGAREKIVYLTNIESLSKTLQEKLTHALKNEPVKKRERILKFLPVRVFAASSKDLRALAKKGHFNKELLDIFEDAIIEIPPLRKHTGEIPVLIQSYLHESSKNGEPPRTVDQEALNALCNYDWPENIKELRSVLEQVMIAGSSRHKITLQDLPPAIRGSKIRIGAAEGNGSSGKKRHYPQRTLKRSVVLCGSGLHSGIKTGLILQPLPPGSGIIFGDISSGDTVPARLENVQSTDYSTCLKKGFTTVGTIEHIMAVLHMYRISNLLIKIGDEAPVMDGSAKDFCQLIEDGDFEDQEDTWEEIVIDREYTFGNKENGGSFISIEPADKFAVSYHMDYPEPIGIQDYTYEFNGAESFKREIAPARTFGFLKDVAQLTKMGFASGGKLDNFILLGDKKVLNTELRFKDEFARHKILDILGDFYLLGRPIRGILKAHKSGHTENVGLLQKISASFS